MLFGRRSTVLPPEPVRLGDLGLVENEVARLVAGAEPDHQAVRERPWLRALVADVVDREPDLLADLAYDALLERLAGLDEPGEARQHPRRPADATGEQHLLIGAVVAASDERDHRRRQARERLEPAGRALHRHEPPRSNGRGGAPAAEPVRPRPLDELDGASVGDPRDLVDHREQPAEIDVSAVARVVAVGHVDGVQRMAVEHADEMGRPRLVARHDRR